MAAGCVLYRGVDRFRRVQWTLSDGETLENEIAELMIKHNSIVDVADSLFSEIGELSQTFRYVGD